MPFARTQEGRTVNVRLAGEIPAALLLLYFAARRQHYHYEGPGKGKQDQRRWKMHLWLMATVPASLRISYPAVLLALGCLL